jgi:FtsH-binding integral membrane protein
MVHANESIKSLGDAASVVTVVGTLSDMLPAVAALFTIVWTGLRIYETDTIQKLLGKKKNESQDQRSED